MNHSSLQQYPIPFEEKRDLSLEEALANARAAMNEKSRGFRKENPAHLPSDPEHPELYALCPGCKVHPAGGIYPAVELLRERSCPTGERLARDGAAGESSGEKESPAGDREGSLCSTFMRSAQPSSSLLLDSGAKGWLRTDRPSPETESLTPGPRPETGPRFFLTPVLRLCSDGVRRVQLRCSRAWYFHRRRSVCKKRLSQIASLSSSTS